MTSIFQASLFRHYRRILAPMNYMDAYLQSWLTIVSCIMLGYALFHTTFLVFGFCLIWVVYPVTSTYMLYTPLSVSFWLCVISFFTTIHSLKLCFAFPKEFRLLLLIEQGLSLKIFLLKSFTKISYISLLFIIIILLFYFFPKVFIIIFWSAPLFTEFYCLSTLTNSFLKQKLFANSTQNFAALLGFEYNYLNSANNTSFFLSSDTFLDDWFSNEQEEISFEDDLSDDYAIIEPMETFETDTELLFDDIEDTPYNLNELAYNRRISTPFLSKILGLDQRPRPRPKYFNPKFTFKLPPIGKENRYRRVDYFAALKEHYSEFEQLQDLSLDFKYQYKKVPLLYRYLSAKKELVLPKENKNITKNLVNFQLQWMKNYKTVEAKLWAKANVNKDILRVPTQQSWYNASVPLIYDSVFTEYEKFSDYLNENSLDFEDSDLDDIDDPDFEFFEQESTQQEIFGPDKNTDENVDFSENYFAPNWFWVSFFYYTISFWALINLFMLVFFFICGIPETWLLSTRTAGSGNILLYNTLLTMTEQLYSKWGFEKLPYGNFSRIEYFNYIQPAYFLRTKKHYSTVTQTTFVLKEAPLILEPYWSKSYEYQKLYGIAQGPTQNFEKPNFPNFNSYLHYRKHTRKLFIHHMELPQNLTDIYLNKDYFVKKDKQVAEFYLFFKNSTK